MKRFIITLIFILMLIGNTYAITITSKPLNDGHLAPLGSQTTIYTVPASTTTTIRTVWISNVTSSDATLKLWFVPTGQSIGDAYLRIPDRIIPPGDIAIIFPWMPLTTGYTIQIESDTASAISIQIGGYEEVP